MTAVNQFEVGQVVCVDNVITVYGLKKKKKSKILGQTNGLCFPSGVYKVFLLLKNKSTI